ncbi:hypothetical protein NLZ15_17475 [Atlantibacter subterranea]|uniref:hypothetical protein n=1 Tax=Atlantibacter subterraneus TaxID=255519 RepID=UPI0020C36B15|nr:hypothetical protein [Atlantibacter subterranea]UTJ46152.1 hypothetical protein NLZ15_14975 [Atlantibacter subterranea]UTJ46613.1 hypothetical protein NLZ15_17475 [Atlantibacter subterranea]
MTTAEQLAKSEPSLDSMLRAHEVFYSTDNVREAMLKAYRIMLADAVKTAGINLTVEG